MHFRVRDKAIQLIRTSYDAEKKRGSAKVVGSVSRRSMTLPEDIASKLTEEEKKEFQTFQTSQSELAVLEAKLAAHSFPATVRKIMTYIEETQDEEERELLRSYIDSALFDLRKYSKRTKA
ncbi:hypothetical protein SAMN02745194_00128 [Roseomonas rosea]|uniref:Uncharacterized protein n=1 Tax=Muricoccus roseus TaxID=198092 RepID=A0A1M6AHU9_9PROT|nr:hypothetical protein [Roseomonas rosea]SHI35908.1 hypothetical protein SAMN02745194_00128 [Roseomonas rosea]